MIPAVSAPDRPSLTIGCTFSDRIEALLDGRVKIDGFDATLRCVEAQALFRTTLNESTFDIAELSLASHVAAVATGRRGYVGIPVFLSRSFRHSNLYIRTDRGIDRPEDLAGKRIGLVDYQQTAALWLRGLLADDHGVKPSSIEWITAGLHAPVLTDRMAMDLPTGIRVSRSPETLNDLLATGGIDAVISPSAPRCFTERSAPVDRLWPNYRVAETAFWHCKRLFPIMHLLVIRRSLTEQYPALIPAVYDAFARALSLALTDLANRDFPKCAVPWMTDHVEGVLGALGEQPWTYGIEANRTVLNLLLSYATTDGLAPRSLTLKALFE